MLRKSNIGVQLHYAPVHLQPYYRKMGFRESNFPETKSYGANSISLPLYPGLSKEQQDKVISILSSIL